MDTLMMNIYLPVYLPDPDISINALGGSWCKKGGVLLCKTKSERNRSLFSKELEISSKRCCVNDRQLDPVSVIHRRHASKICGPEEILEVRFRIKGTERQYLIFIYKEQKR